MNLACLNPAGLPLQDIGMASCGWEGLCFFDSGRFRGVQQCQGNIGELLDPSSPRGIYLSRLCGKLFSGSFSTSRFASSLLHPSHVLVIMTCSMVTFCVVRLAGIPWFVMARDIKKCFHIGFSTLFMAIHVKISAHRSQLQYTTQFIHTTACTAQTPRIDHPTTQTLHPACQQSHQKLRTKLWRKRTKKQGFIEEGSCKGINSS